VDDSKGSVQAFVSFRSIKMSCLSRRASSGAWKLYKSEAFVSAFAIEFQCVPKNMRQITKHLTNNISSTNVSLIPSPPCSHKDAQFYILGLERFDFTHTITHSWRINEVWPLPFFTNAHLSLIFPNLRAHRCKVRRGCYLVTFLNRTPKILIVVWLNEDQRTNIIKIYVYKLDYVFVFYWFIMHSTMNIVERICVSDKGINKHALLIVIIKFGEV
jgi:hypothetical protein